MYLPDLRNAVYHPQAYFLCQPTDIDHHLRAAQKVAFMFRDSDRTMQIRSLRDELVAEVRGSAEILGNLSGLIALSSCENLEIKPHHQRIFQIAHNCTEFLPDLAEAAEILRDHKIIPTP
ncbi:hypothetical protein GGR57DRAFT_518961 [Xylariaceae sp. FL1272]|nr:hypothetical protein GGR57DRAFT_518961 [Xylariaceae sp. FL1272]